MSEEAVAGFVELGAAVSKGAKGTSRHPSSAGSDRLGPAAGTAARLAGDQAGGGALAQMRAVCS
jgi:hypothetical protein